MVIPISLNIIIKFIIIGTLIVAIVMAIKEIVTSDAYKEKPSGFAKVVSFIITLLVVTAVLWVVYFIVSILFLFILLFILAIGKVTFRFILSQISFK